MGKLERTPQTCPELEGGQAFKPHIGQSLDGAAAGRKCDFGPLFFNRSNSQSWLAARGHLLAVVPAAGGVSPSFLKGSLGSTSQSPPHSVMT